MNNPRLLFGISGKQFSDKDALCELLLNELRRFCPDPPRPFIRRALADRLKLDWLRAYYEGKIAARSEWVPILAPLQFCFDEEQLIAAVNLLKNTDGYARASLIDFGESAKKSDPLVWVNRCIAPQQLSDKSPHLGIPDVRYLGEVQALHDLSYTSVHRAILLRVEASRETRWQRAAAQGAVLSNENHASETELDGYGAWYRVIDNNGSYAELHAQAQDLALTLTRYLD